MTTQPLTAEQNPAKRVAVIAVHGIGGPAPGRSAQRVAEALLDTEPLSAPATRCEAMTVGPPPGEHDYPGEAYHTVVYSAAVTSATDDGGAATCQADVYEVYWADLSRAGTSVRRLPLDELELAFFPLHLAEQAFAAERRERPADRSLTWAHRLFRLAAVLLAGVIPPLFVFLLTRPAVIALAGIPAFWPWVVVGVVTVVTAVATTAAGWWLVRRAAGYGFRSAAIVAWSCAAVLAGIAVVALVSKPKPTVATLYPAVMCVDGRGIVRRSGGRSVAE